MTQPLVLDPLITDYSHCFGDGKGSMSNPTICLLHWLTCTEDPTFTDEQVFEKKISVLKSANVGYNMMRWNGQSRLLTNPGRKVWHAGGSPGLNGDDNAVSFGVVVPYLSPSYARRGIEGEVELDFVPRDANGKILPVRKAWYPPIDGDEIRALVLAARAFFIQMGWTRGAVLTHYQVNEHAKNDIRNINDNCGTSIAELQILFASP